MPPPSLIPFDLFDSETVLADLEAIRQFNPQRFEMELLTRICHFDLEEGTVAGVLEIPEDPWWARGHIPGRPLMPGVLMVEAAAQLCSWAVRQVYKDTEYADRFFGFGGIDNVKFRGTIFPGSDLLILGRKNDVRPRRAIFDTQGWVGGRLVYEAQITGMWI